MSRSIVFILPGTEGRPHAINGDTIRYKNVPSSGTDQSMILVAEYLAKSGWDATIVLAKTDKHSVNGVNYTDFSFDGINSNIDVLVTSLWFGESRNPYNYKYGYNDIPFRVTEALIYWQHMAWTYAGGRMNCSFDHWNKPYRELVRL